ncbi:MAG: A/G-specific adenine glycosylase [Mycobacterium sp.]|nr:A/G-specific adenine glycosylase [Mycobacterium sp.]
MSIPANDLVQWYARAKRELPWRATGVSAWQILVSEFMLQQTPVARVAPIWVEWVARWPTPSATAAAGAADVLRAWGKLGYPRRAKRLHECAVAIATDHNDLVPDDVDTLLGLPGVGAYTARAVACFAYRKRVPVVDTNVRRVVARAIGGKAEAGNPSTVRDHADVAALLPDDATAAEFSAALMELGATVCTARAPKCGICPLTACAWREGSSVPVPRTHLDVVWLTDTAQRDRALDSLLVDGLVEQTADGRFALAGEGDDARP